LTLDIQVTIEPLNDTNLARTVQLLNKTNQMNLTTRRLTESELTTWDSLADHCLWVFRVSDKFGDLGLTGIVSLAVEESRGRIIDFILSCRVMGRNIEEAMVRKIFQYARSLGLTEIYADYLPTKKNRPCLDFWKRSGFDFNEKNSRFSWPLDREYPAPEGVRVIEK
jgi:FkbH-like protein